LSIRRTHLSQTSNGHMLETDRATGCMGVGTPVRGRHYNLGACRQSGGIVAVQGYAIGGCEYCCIVCTTLCVQTDPMRSVAYQCHSPPQDSHYPQSMQTVCNPCSMQLQSSRYGGLPSPVFARLSVVPVAGGGAEAEPKRAVPTQRPRVSGAATRGRWHCNVRPEHGK